MMTIPLSTLAIVFYVGASLLQSVGLYERVRPIKRWLWVFGCVAVAIHGVLLYHWIDVVAGQNLTVFNMLSLMTWVVSLLVLLLALFKPVEILTIFCFPLAVLSILLVLGFPGQFIIAANANPHELIHILLSVITIAVLCLSALQAIVLAIQDYVIRLKPAGRLINQLPPLVEMEKLLFHIITAGFLLLSVLLGMSIYFFHNILMQDPLIFQKTILAVFAWVIFALLLLGRSLWGWRGRKAIYWTLSGVLLLVIVYFGSKLLLWSSVGH